jgi:hypothetical protein
MEVDVDVGVGVGAGIEVDMYMVIHGVVCVVFGFESKLARREFHKRVTGRAGPPCLALPCLRRSAMVNMKGFFLFSLRTG